MGTLREEVYLILETDAKSGAAGSLGVLLGKAATAPYGVYHIHPPVQPDFPVITYFFGSSSQRLPREIFFMVTAWGTERNDYETILKRIYTLLHEARLTLTDYSHKMIKWNWQSAEMFDPNLKCYYQQARYWFKGVKS